MKKSVSILMIATMAILLVFATGCGKKEQKTLRVGMECSYAPYNWTQSDDKNGAVSISGSSDYANGYDVMMAKKVADALGMKLEIVKQDWDSLVPGVQSGTLDCVIAGQSITAERMQSVNFSKPYYYATIVALVKSDGAFKDAKSIKDLKGAKATSQINTVWYDKCLPQIPGVVKLPAQDQASTMLVALESGKCDVVVTDMPTAKAACIVYKDFKLLDFAKSDAPFSVSDEDINIGISLKKENADLLAKINKVLETMTTEDYNSMMDKAIANQPLRN